MKLFLESVKKETKISNLFGKEKERVFRDQNNFHKVLAGLSKLSHHFHGEIRGFDVHSLENFGKGSNKPLCLG